MIGSTEALSQELASPGIAVINVLVDAPILLGKLDRASSDQAALAGR